MPKIKERFNSHKLDHIQQQKTLHELLILVPASHVLVNFALDCGQVNFVKAKKIYDEWKLRPPSDRACNYSDLAVCEKVSKLFNESFIITEKAIHYITTENAKKAV